MIEIKEKDKCCGCYACFNVCPKDAIVMQEDDYGFKYPFVDKNKCINCGLCERTCPILNTKSSVFQNKAYAVINKDDIIRENSSSGGVFNLIASFIIENNGIVFGAAFDDENVVEHMEIDNKNDIDKLMKSKYVQSEIGNTYKKCEEYLKSGRKVLFTGTPCQIEGLLKYLNNSYDNLFTQDIICHGVPSPKIWRIYLKSIEKINAKNINFRNKKYGWENYSLKCDDLIISSRDNYYCKAFIDNLILRDSCYNCHFKKTSRWSDITLGDFWGIDKIDKTMNDNKGTSLVIVNSDKGQQLLDYICSNCIVREVDFSKSISYNTAYNESANKPKKRDYVFNTINEDNFDSVVTNATKITLSKKFLRKLKCIIKK